MGERALGQVTFSDKALIERHSIPEPNTGCWLWTGSVNTHGYGRVGNTRRERGAHRLAYAAFVGPIPSGALVLHRCDVPLCVNPEHLWLGDLRENAIDMVKKGRGFTLRAEQNPRSKLTAAAVLHIRLSHGETSITSLARMFGVSRRAIRFVITGATWKTV